MLLVIPNQIRFLQKFSYQLRSVIKKKKKKNWFIKKKGETKSCSICQEKYAGTRNGRLFFAASDATFQTS